MSLGIFAPALFEPPTPEPIQITRTVIWSTETIGAVVATRIVAWSQEGAVRDSVVGPLTPDTTSGDQLTGGCCPTPPDDYPFRRLIVSYRASGGARVEWELDPDFEVPDNTTYQLAASQSGTVDADDWFVIGNPVRNAAYLADSEQRMFGVASTLHYRVTMDTGDATYTSKPSRVSVQTPLSYEDWLRLREISRKEHLRGVLKVGARGQLLKAKRYGILCSSVDPVTREQTKSSCLVCYGKTYVGGYYQPVPCWYGDLTPEEVREFTGYNETRGTVRDVNVWARMPADVPIVSGDAWISDATDNRYYVHTVKTLVEWRGVPIVYAVELRLAPKSDVLYKVPVTTANTGCSWGRPDLREVEIVCPPS